MILHFAAYRAARRALAHDQRRPQPCNLPTWRLLLGEVGVLANRVGRWRVTCAALAAFISFLLVEIALSSRTPGPALAEPWRWLTAAGLTVVSVFVWATVHAIRNTSDKSDES